MNGLDRRAQFSHIKKLTVQCSLLLLLPSLISYCAVDGSDN